MKKRMVDGSFFKTVRWSNTFDSYFLCRACRHSLEPVLSLSDPGLAIPPIGNVYGQQCAYVPVYHGTTISSYHIGNSQQSTCCEFQIMLCPIISCFGGFKSTLIYIDYIVVD